MTKKDLVAKLAEKLDSTKVEAEGILELLFSEIIIPALKAGDEVVLPELGKLKVRATKERKGVTNGKSWTKPAGKKVSLKVSSTFEL